MIKKVVTVLVTIVLAGTLSAQNSAMHDNLKRIFVGGTIADKIEVIENAADQPGSESLIVDGLQFADTYAYLLGNEQSMIQLAAVATQNAVLCDGADTCNLVMGLFQKYEDSVVKKACLNYMLTTKRSSEKIAPLVENYAMSLLNDGKADEDIMLSCLTVLDKIHSNSSFSVFFNYAASPFLSTQIQNQARDSMNSYTDIYRINMLSIITDAPVPNKLSALKMILSNDANSDILRAEASETALSTSIIHVGDTFDASLTDLQLTALAELRRLSWTRSARLVADYFSVAKGEYEAGILMPQEFIEVIDSVRELSVVKAGTLLSEYLSVCNANVENGLSYSVPVVLAVINSLGALGDKVSFDALLYVSYVPYPVDIVVASREALARLKW